MSTCECNSCPTTRTLSSGGNNTSKSSHSWTEWENDWRSIMSDVFKLLLKKMLLMPSHLSDYCESR